MNELKLRTATHTPINVAVKFSYINTLIGNIHLNSRQKINIPATVKISDKSVNDNYCCSCRRVYTSSFCRSWKNPKHKPSLYHGRTQSINNRNLSDLLFLHSKFKLDCGTIRRQCGCCYSIQSIELNWEYYTFVHFKHMSYKHKNLSYKFDQGW